MLECNIKEKLGQGDFTIDVSGNFTGTDKSVRAAIQAIFDERRPVGVSLKLGIIEFTGAAPAAGLEPERETEEVPDETDDDCSFDAAVEGIAKTLALRSGLPPGLIDALTFNASGGQPLGPFWHRFRDQAVDVLNLVAPHLPDADAHMAMLSGLLAISSNQYEKAQADKAELRGFVERGLRLLKDAQNGWKDCEEMLAKCSAAYDEAVIARVKAEGQRDRAIAALGKSIGGE